MTEHAGPVLVVWSWSDETGTKSKPRMHLPHNQISDAALSAIAMADKAAALSLCRLDGFSLNYRVVNVVGATTGAQTVKVVAVLIFRCEGDERLIYEQPGLKADLIEADLPAIEVPPFSPEIEGLAETIIAQEFCSPRGFPAQELIAVMWRQDT